MERLAHINLDMSEEVVVQDKARQTISTFINEHMKPFSIESAPTSNMKQRYATLNEITSECVAFRRKPCSPLSADEELTGVSNSTSPVPGFSSTSSAQVKPGNC